MALALFAGLSGVVGACASGSTASDQASLHGGGSHVGGAGSGTIVAGPAGVSGGGMSPAGGAGFGGALSGAGGASAGTSGSGVSTVVGGGGASGSGTTTAGTSSGGVSAGANTGGAAMGGSGVGGKPCVDVQPPEDPKWPGATCENWALETKECGEDWFKNYCDVSCGRCTPESNGTAGTGGGSSAATDCSNAGLPNVSGGDGFATRYWDCCQTHCSQFDGHRCGQDGKSGTGDTNSACNGGGSFACYDQAPKAISDCLSYGYIAKANPNCGGCYRIQFTGEGYHNANDVGSRRIKGKQMIVKVSNTGGDVAGNQFDLMIPGGGVGRFNACSRQWGSNDLGAQYGGFLTNCTGGYEAKKECVRQKCNLIPDGPARQGCLWFVDWFEIADNPKFTSQSTNCPF